MKATKFILSVFFILYSVEGFSQTNINKIAICTTPGSLASLSVDYPVTTPPTIYQWQVKSGAVWNSITSSIAGSVYTGYNSSTLNINKSTTVPNNGTLYRVLVNGIDYLDVFELIVDLVPLSKTISLPTPVCAGGNKTLNYAINSVGDIQWQASSTNIPGDFYDIDGANLGSYTASDLQETTWFRVMNTSGKCGSDYSNLVQVVVDPLPYAGIIDGGDINVCKTSNLTELTLIDGPVGDIKWQKTSEVAAGLPVNYTNITNANSVKYTASSLIATTYFRAVLSSGVCDSQITQPVAITVDPAPNASSITGASTICFGESKKLTYGTDSVGDILWQYSTTSNLTGFYDLDGETERTYTATDLQETTWFRVMNTSGECGSKYSDPVQVVVNPLAVAGNIDGGDVTVCNTSNSTELTLYNSEGTIQWQKASDVAGVPGTFADISSSNLVKYTASSLLATTYFRAKVSSGVCAFEYTDPVVITVVPLPVTKSITGASTAFTGGSITLTYGLGSTGDIQWQYSTISGSEGFYDLDGEIEGTYTAIDLQKTTWFRVMNTNGVCSVYSLPFQVKFNSLAVPVFNNVDSEFKVIAFPNPFETEFNINLTPQSLDPVELKIYDMLGRLIENHHVKSSEIDSMRIGTTYPSGFFTVLIKQGQQERKVKVLKK